MIILFLARIVQASLLMVLFLTGLGMILNWNGTNIRAIGTGFPYSFKLEFAGAIVATFFSVSKILSVHKNIRVM